MKYILEFKQKSFIATCPPLRVLYNLSRNLNVHSFYVEKNQNFNLAVSSNTKELENIYYFCTWEVTISVNQNKIDIDAVVGLSENSGTIFVVYATFFVSFINISACNNIFAELNKSLILVLISDTLLWLTINIELKDRKVLAPDIFPKECNRFLLLILFKLLCLWLFNKNTFEYLLFLQRKLSSSYQVNFKTSRR